MTKKKNKKPNHGQVIIPTGHPNPPEPHEIGAAWIIARYYGCIIEFLIPIDDYMRKTPDCIMFGVLTEIKSPTGNSKRKTVEEQFERASKQGARWLIFDGRRTKLPDDFLVKEIKKELVSRRKIKKVIFIDKNKSVVEFNK